MLTASQPVNRLPAAAASGTAYPPYGQELQMSEVYARPEPSLIPIPRPLCPTCQRSLPS